jgi:hypothetical protein
MDELIKAGTEIARVAGPLAAVIPFTAIVKRMLGPAADEISERIRDEVRVYRYARQLKLLEKAERMANEAGFTPKAVPIKLLFPLLEGASLEEDDGLHDLWAGLLANASHDVTANLVRPSFIELLKMMTPDVATLLDAAYEEALKSIRPKRKAPSSELGIMLEDSVASAFPDELDKLRAITSAKLGRYQDLFRLFKESGCAALPSDTVVLSDAPRELLQQDGADRHRFSIAMDELRRMQMWDARPGQNSGESYYLTALAAQFVTVCRRPKARQSAE